jgi:anti-sigma-K factor RskA
VRKNIDEILELLSDKALGELSEAKLAEFRELVKDCPDLEKIVESFELAAAAINLAHIETVEPLPSHLQKKLLETAEQYFPKTQKPKVEEQKQQILTFKPEKPQSRIFAWLGWGVAAVACILLAINIWFTRSNTNKQLSLDEQRQMILQMPDAIKLQWKDPKTKETLGDLVWSNSAQKGFARFYKLPVNEPSKETYQLWVIDENQKSPTDAGLFNVTAQQEVVLPIDTRIKVDKPKMFAVTLEKAGGVVIPSLEKIMAVAEIETKNQS